MLFEITTACSNFRNLKSKQTDLTFKLWKYWIIENIM
jgi:hypothetical protein